MTGACELLRPFDALNAAARAALDVACSGVISVPADTDLRRQGEALDRLHVLVDGWACRTKLRTDGRRQIPLLLLPGNACDLDGLGAACLPYGVTTLTRARVAVWSHRSLAVVLRDHPGVASAVLRLALAENMRMTQSIAVLGRHSARERMAHLLCEVLARLEALGLVEADGCALPLTQAELGDALGLSAVHVNRVLQQLRDESLIRLVDERLTVLDREGLCAAGQFRPDHLLVDEGGPDLLTQHMGERLRTPCRAKS